MINQDVIFKIIEDKALCDPSIYVVCGDGLDTAFFSKLKEQFPKRVITCGISEQNQVSIANGIALGGKRVYCLMMNSFLIHRALDQLKMACYSNANIKFLGYTPNIIPMAGGYSHLSIDDFSILKNTPNLKLFDPYTESEIKNVMQKSFDQDSPMYIACSLDSIDSLYKNKNIKNGFTKLIDASKNFCIISSGDSITYLFSGNILQDISDVHTMPSCYSAYEIEPFDKETCREIVSKYNQIVTFEARGKGGLSSSVAEVIAMSNSKTKLLPVYFDNKTYNIVGYGDYAVEQYLKLSNLHMQIKDFFKNRGNYFFRVKSRKHGNRIILKHKFLGFTYLKKEIVI